MGLKKIAEMRNELSAKAAAMQKFEGAAKEFNDAYTKMTQAYENVDKLRRDKLGAVAALDTLGIKEFEEYKKSLVAVYQGLGNRALPTDPLRAVVQAQKAKIDAAVNERIAKLAASFPAEVKKGMVFRFEANGKLREIASDATPAKNANLKGDAAIWFDTVDESGGKSPISLADLKKMFKFIRA